MVLACLPKPTALEAALLYGEDPAGDPEREQNDAGDHGEETGGGSEGVAGSLVRGAGLTRLAA